MIEEGPPQAQEKECPLKRLKDLCTRVDGNLETDPKDWETLKTLYRILRDKPQLSDAQREALELMEPLVAKYQGMDPKEAEPLLVDGKMMRWEKDDESPKPKKGLMNWEDSELSKKTKSKKTKKEDDED
jgi:hypothetical protein